MRVNTKPPVNEKQAAYEAVLAESMRKPFERGVHDCVTFVAACTLALTGRDILDGVERWTTDREAFRVIKKMGGLRAAFTSVLGEPTPPLMARVGDIVMAANTQSPEPELMAICHGPHLVSTGTLGLCILPLSAGICAWRVNG